MLFRLVLLVALAVIGLAAYGKLRTPPLLRIPRKWRELAKEKNSSFRKALGHRQGMAHLLLAGKAGHTELLLVEVDNLLKGMAELQTQKLQLAGAVSLFQGETNRVALQRSLALEENLRQGAHLLDLAHSHLLGVTAQEFDAATNTIRENLREKGAAFQATLEAYQNIDNAHSALLDGEST